MKLFSNWYIATKLLLINLAIFVIISGVITTVFFSFRMIERKMTGIMNQDVTQVIMNAQTGRELTRIFADTANLVDGFLDQEDLVLQTEGNQLIVRTTTLMTQNTGTDLGTALQ